MWCWPLNFRVMCEKHELRSNFVSMKTYPFINQFGFAKEFLRELLVYHYCPSGGHYSIRKVKTGCLFLFKSAWRIHGFKFSFQVFVRLSFISRHWHENVSSDQKSRTCTLYRFTLIVMPNRVKDADINDITADSRLLCLLIQLEIRYLM